MKTLPFVFLSSAFSFPAEISDELETIHVPADPKARYEVIELSTQDDGLRVITTKRTGSSGASYSKRLVDCETKQAKYLGDGDTIKAMNRSKPSPKMGPWLEGSSTHAISKYACNKS